MAALDADSDGQLSEKELKACPGMLKAIGRYDENSDGAISADEITSRWTRVNEMPDVPQTPICSVTKSGRPLAGVTVMLEPEAFLADAIAPAHAETDRNGTCQPKAEGSPGLAAGIYKVRITDRQNKIPAKYNTETILGVELSFDLGRDAESPQFDLKF
ncbi:MAG: hypothetical protein ACR2NU_05985 [Aeoliella sp.]